MATSRQFIMRHLRTFLLAAAFLAVTKVEAQNAFPFIDRSQQYWSDWIAADGSLNFSNRNGGFLTLTTNALQMLGLNHAPGASSLSIGVPVGGGVDFYMPHAYTSGDNFKFTFGDAGASSFIQIYFSQTAVLHNYYGYYVENAGGVPASIGALGSLSVGFGGNMNPTTLAGATVRFTGTGVYNDANGIKHIRLSTGSISGGTSSLITATWTTAFADANYTVTASVLDSTAATASLNVVHVESISASQVKVRVSNTSAGALTGTLHIVAMHD
jgi:hypothetical protein